MKPVKIESLARALFQAIPCYLDYSSGHCTAGFTIPNNQQINSERYMELPHFFIAHVEQIYLREKYGESDEYKEYGLDTYPTFPLEFSDELSALESKYSHKAHIFIMDRLDEVIELDYWDFIDKHCIEIAKNWCKANGIEFEYMFKEE